MTPSLIYFFLIKQQVVLVKFIDLIKKNKKFMINFSKWLNSNIFQFRNFYT